ncbi:hypothetical protein NE865_15059 [Phthorimaea operculella]|nr:hypothetical protein NE865_15059 [Phthorimaea operculella]
MPDQCAKCKQFLPNTKVDVVECKKCHKSFHKKCLSKKLCDGCEESKNGGGNRTPTGQTPTPKEGSEAVLHQINERIAIVEDMKKELTELSNQLKYYAEKYKELSDFKVKAEERMKKNENQIKDLQQKNMHLEKCNKMMEERICGVENREKAKNVELLGVQMNDNEKVPDTVRKFAQKMQLNAAEIESAWRVGRESKNGKPRPIVVRMRSRVARDDWLRARKRCINNKQLFGNDNEDPIYINEDITRQTRDLFWFTKNKLKDSFNFIWIQNARILVKKSESINKVHQINSEGDVEKLLLGDTEERRL